MTTARGMTSGMGSSQLYQKMMENPIHQQRQRQQQLQEGRDNRAVSQMDRVAGADIASERQRYRGIEQVGMQLSRRADKLDFARRGMDFQKEQATIRSGQFDQAMDFKTQTSGAEYSQKMRELKFRDTSNTDIALGLASVGVNLYRDQKSKEQHKDLMAALREDANAIRLGDLWTGGPY